MPQKKKKTHYLKRKSTNKQQRFWADSKAQDDIKFLRQAVLKDTSKTPSLSLIMRRAVALLAEQFRKAEAMEELDFEVFKILRQTK